MNRRLSFFSAERISAQTVSTFWRVEMSDWRNLRVEVGFRDVSSVIRVVACDWERPIR